MPKNPEKTIKKLSGYAKNPDFARFQDDSEKTEHLETIAENLKPVSHVTSFVQHFLDEVKPKKGIDYLPDEEMQAIKKEAKGEKGDKGEDGKTPEFGKDYFTPEHVSEIKAGIRKEVTPQKGKHYFTPEEVEQFKKNVTPKKGVDYYEGRDGKDGRDGISLRGYKGDKGDKGDPGRDGKSVEDIDPKILIKKIKTLKGNDRLDISDLRNGEQLARAGKQKANDGDLRWHGGAPNFLAGSNITLTKSSNGANVTISASGGGGGGFALLSTMSTVDGSNKAFVFSTATAKPSLIFSDGVALTPLDNNMNIQWTWNTLTLTATLAAATAPPTNSLFGIQ